MKRFLGLAIGLFSVIGFISSAEAINIDVAEVQNGAAFVQGGKAAASATITWEGGNVTTANKNGGFKFSGVVPADCVGTLSDGKTTIEVVVLDCTSISVAPAPVPKTGLTHSYAAGDDGALQKGVAWPTPRFTDNNNGTITDNLTGLIWLKNANCPNVDRGWAQALADVGNLNTNGTMNGNNCGDTSNGGSHQTAWRLPNIRELFSLARFASSEPLLSDTFTGFQESGGLSTYWSSTANDWAPNLAWVVDFDGNYVVYNCPGGVCGPTFVLPVRGP